MTFPEPGPDAARHFGALLRSRLDRCDRDGQPAYLEAAKTTSVPLYQHFGFELRASLRG